MGRSKNIKAIIWAGGLGTRLRPLTYKKQKCMIDIAGKPCLERNIENLEKYNIQRIIVKVGYKKEQIIDCFGNRVLYYYQDKLKEENESLQELAKYVFDDFTIVMNGDTLTNIDLDQMFKMSGNRNIRLMDNKKKDLYAGVKILSPAYWQGDNKFINYYQPDPWFDIGTWTGLIKARKYYEENKEITDLS